ncbi:MAG: DJ-1/PfpI family protein [Cyanobacteria bacterium P01_F01_bin.143]
MGNESIAILLYPGFTALDVVGPQYMFASMMGAKVHLVAKTMEPVASDTGFSIMPTATFNDMPEKLTVLMIPGSGKGVLQTMQDSETMDFVHQQGLNAEYVTSVCTGSLILGAAGLLEGYRATSHWIGLESLEQFGATPVNQRVVEDRNRITAAGVSAGLDFGLTMVAKFRGDLYAQSTQLLAEYAPEPPFNAGSKETAPAKVRRYIEGLFAGYSEKVIQAGQAAYQSYITPKDP